MSMSLVPPGIPSSGISPGGRALQPLTDAPFGGSALPIISIRDIVEVIFRHMLAIVLILGLSVFGSVGYVMLVTPSYVSEVKVLVRIGREKLAPLTLGTEPTSNFLFNERVENTNDQIEILRNPAMMAKVFPTLRDRYLEMAAMTQQKPPPETILQWAKYIFSQAKDMAKDAADWVMAMAKEPLYLLGISQRPTPEEMLFEQFRASFWATFIKETNVIVLSFAWSDPHFAAFALNAYVDTYRREHVRVLSDLSGAVAFYDAQAERTDRELTRVNQEIDRYLADERLMDPVSEKQLALALINTLERQQSDARITEQQTKARLASFQRKYHETDEWLETPGIAQVTLSGMADLDARHGELLTRRNALLTQLRPTAREVKNLDAEIAALRTAKLNGLMNYLTDRLANEQEEQRVVSAKLDEQRERLERLNVVTARYSTMQDRRDQLQNQLKSYRKQIEGLGVHQALNEQNFASIAVLNQATPASRPSVPRKGMIVGLAALFGLLFAVSYVILREFFDNSFANERDVSQGLGLPVVATVPDIRTR